MEQTITFREIKRQDEPALETIIKDTWNYERFCSKKTAQQLARVYLRSCLCNQTFTRVALVNDIAVGIIMGKNERKHSYRFKDIWRMIYSMIALLVHKEGRKAVSVFGCVNKIDQDLVKNRTYDGEVAFFAIDKKQRGKGIGKQLFLLWKEEMIQAQIKQYFLFTDTSCNYPFYEHLGMIRRGEKQHSFLINGVKADMSFFLYDDQLPGKVEKASLSS